MSTQVQRSFTCPNCSLEQQFAVYENVNVTVEPGLKKALIERTLAKFKCKGCSRTLEVRHPILYNDVKNKVMIWYPKDQGSKPSVDEGSVVMNMMAKTGYRFRRVASYNQLIEKIRLFDEGQDDRALELLKAEVAAKKRLSGPEHLFYQSVAQKASGKKILRLAEVKKQGTVFHDVPIEELQRRVAILAQVPESEPEPGTWADIDHKYVAKLTSSR